MLNKALILLSLSFMLFVASCSDSDNPVTPQQQIVGSGDLITYDLTLAPFTSISCSGFGRVLIQQGGSHSVSVTVDDNVEEYLVITVSNGVLNIGTTPGVSFTNVDLTINLTMTDLESLSLSGAGNIIVQDLFVVDDVSLSLPGAGNISLYADADLVNSSLSGAGNLIFIGSAQRHQISLSGAGNILAYGMTTDTTFVSLSGVGNAQVHVGSYLNVSIPGQGSVYYRGSPAIDVSITGQGQLINAN